MARGKRKKPPREEKKGGLRKRESQKASKGLRFRARTQMAVSFVSNEWQPPFQKGSACTSVEVHLSHNARVACANRPCREAAAWLPPLVADLQTKTRLAAPAQSLARACRLVTLHASTPPIIDTAPFCWADPLSARGARFRGKGTFMQG